MFIEAFVASSIWLAASDPQPVWCMPQEEAVVRVGLVAPKPTSDFSKTMAQLEGIQIDTKNPYGDHVDTHVGGLTTGVIKVEQKMSLGGVRYGTQSCLWYSRVDVTIRLNQKVRVAHEYKPGTCMHDAVWEHEHKHIRVDREIINAYRPVYQKKIARYLSRAYVMGPMEKTEEKSAQATMMANLQQVISTVTAEMEKERAKQQQAVDTREEYDRVTALCAEK